MRPPPFRRPVPRSESDSDYERDYPLYRQVLLACGRTAEEADRKVAEVRIQDEIERPARIARANAYQAALVLGVHRGDSLVPSGRHARPRCGVAVTRRRLPFTPEQIATICTLRPAGASWRAIGRRIGRPHVGCRRLWVQRATCAGGVLP